MSQPGRIRLENMATHSTGMKGRLNFDEVATLAWALSGTSSVSHELQRADEGVVVDVYPALEGKVDVADGEENQRQE